MCMKRVLSYTFISILGFLAAACGESDPESKLDRLQSAESFNVVTPVGDARSVADVIDNVRYSFAFNDDERTVSFTIFNFRLSADEVPADYSFVNVPWVYSVGTPEVRRIIDVPGLSPDSPQNAPHSFTDVHIVYYEPKGSAYGNRGVSASFTVDGMYHVHTYPYIVVGEGTTVCVNEITQDSRLCYTTVAELEFQPHNSKATISLNELLPDESGIGLWFAVENVDVVFNQAGYSLYRAEAVEVDGGVTVYDLSGEATMTDELHLSFKMVLPDESVYDVDCYLSPNLTPQNL